jgi:hypothetical protein
MEILAPQEALYLAFSYTDVGLEDIIALPREALLHFQSFANSLF